MSSGNGLLPPMRPSASAAKKPSIPAAKKPSVPAAAKDPFEFEPGEAEPRSNGGKASKPLEAAAKTATPAAGKATPKPPTKGSGKGTTTSKENVFDFPADDDGRKAEREVQRPARKQPAQPAPKKPAAKQPAAKQPAAKQPAAKQPAWVEPAAKPGSAKTFGRKSTPKPSGNTRGKDVLSAPDLDDVFDFAPPEAPLPRGATG